LGCSIEDAVKKGVGDAIEKGAKDHGDRLYSALNRWAKLIDDYHSADPAVRQEAERFIKETFQRALPVATDPFRIKLEFSGIDTSDNRPLRVSVLRDHRTQTTNIAALVKEVISNGTRADLTEFKHIQGHNPQQVIKLSDLTKTAQEIEAEVKSNPLHTPLLVGRQYEEYDFFLLAFLSRETNRRSKARNGMLAG
jgi:hypothetical protein